MKKFVVLVVVSLSMSLCVTAQDFEGIIEFKKQEGKVVENTVWYVKGDLVRIDEFEPGSRMLKSATILNLKDSSITYLDHQSKTWSRVKNHLVVAGAPVNFSVTETKNTKELHTYKTTESVIKTGGDSTFSYWTNTGKFGFFRTALYLYGPRNSYLEYYWMLKPKDNSMPMLVTKQNLKGEETGRMEVTRIEKRTVDEKLFGVPADYKEKK